MKTLTVRVDNKGVHYASAGVFSWETTNLPVGNFRFREREVYHWEVAMRGYDEATSTLHLEVVDYAADPTDFRSDRRMRKPVNKLVFAPLDGEEFRAQLAYYRAGELRPFLAAEPAPPPSDPVPQAAASMLPQAPVRRVEFSLPLLDFTFGNGGVTAEATLPGLAERLTVRIPNDHLVAEFDAIKPFFVRALKRKTARVTANLVFRDDGPVLADARSPQIAAIDDGMLEIFRVRALRQLTGGSAERTVDKGLFTPEDIFASLDDDELGKAVLPPDGRELLAAILEHQEVRNARQLSFLSGRLHAAGQKLRFVLTPHFGFVFVAEGRDGRHFILELLDSHATYVWSMPKDWRTLEAQFRAVEKEIAAIAAMGRGQYRRTLHFEHEFWFVIHEAADSGVVDGFPRWRNRLLEGLV